MDWLREGLGVGGFASNLAFGIWLSAMIGAWIFGFGALLMSLRRVHRRFVRTLNYATITCAVELMGLIAMMLKDNPGRWERVPWLVSFMPFLLAFFSVIIAACRGDAAASRTASGKFKVTWERGAGPKREATPEPNSESVGLAASSARPEAEDMLFASVTWSTDSGPGYLESPIGGKDF